MTDAENRHVCQGKEPVIAGMLHTTF